MTFEEWWETKRDKAIPMPYVDAWRECWDMGRAYEREACAKVCDDERKKFVGFHMPSHAVGASMCAEAIRNRKEM